MKSFCYISDFIIVIITSTIVIIITIIIIKASLFRKLLCAMLSIYICIYLCSRGGENFAKAFQG
jgi:hypothetical protein